ncbi:MAG: hypothetical protein Kow0074_21680 [Candidatus Zixiibacteriota bacterium]
MSVYTWPETGETLTFTDRVDILFDFYLSSDSALSILKRENLQLLDSSTFRHNLWYCALADSSRESTIEVGNRIHRRPDTRLASARLADGRVSLHGVPADSYFVHQYYLDNRGQTGGTAGVDIDAVEAWEIPVFDSSVVVAILDDGFNAHPEFAGGRLLKGYDFAGLSLFNADPDDSAAPGVFKNHGMACAGILAASHNGTGIAGVCGVCKILPLKILHDIGVGDAQTPFRFAEIAADAIDAAADSGAQVISLSWDYNGAIGSDLIREAIDSAVNACSQQSGQRTTTRYPVIVVASSGNAHEVGPDTVLFPANMDSVISVGGIDKHGAVWAYSNRSNNLDVVAPCGDVADILGDPNGDQWTVDQRDTSEARGWNPAVTGGDPNETSDYSYTALMGGTSGACPQVAGIVALLLSRGHPDLDSACPRFGIIRDIITNSAIDIGSVGEDRETGHGRANAFRAMLAIVRGDLDNNGVLDGVDMNLMIADLYFGQTPALFAGLSDVNCDGTCDSVDLDLFINHVYHSGPPPNICYAHYDY